MNNIEMFDGADASGLVEFEAPLALSPLKKNFVDYDNFYPAEGEIGDGEFDFVNEVGGDGESFDFADGTEFDYAEGDAFDYADGYSNVFGARARSRRRARRKARQKRKLIRTRSKARERELQAQAQLVASKNLGKESQSDVELARALATPSPDAQRLSDDKKGLSTGAKIGIGLGIVAVLGVIGFVVYKKMKAKK